MNVLPESVLAVHSESGRHDDDESESVWSILPAELWLDIICLCAPKPYLAATCRSTASQPGSPTHRIWSHRHVYFNPEHDPKGVGAGDTHTSKHAEINSWYPRAAQCESHLAYYLKAHLPTSDDKYYACAAGLAPEPGHHVPTTVFSVAMVEWLFSAAGPFGRPSRDTFGLDVFDTLAGVRPTVRPDLVSDDESDEGEGEDSNADENGAQIAVDASTTNSSPATTWRIIPDPFLLATFFIRTSQLVLLELTLTRMRTLFPALLSSTAPVSLWLRLMLDNRQLRAYLSAIVHINADPHMSYPTFLCFLTLIDWSKPALDVIARVFTDSFDAAIAAKLVTSNHHMMESILSTLHQITSPPSESPRVLSILNWFTANDTHINLDHFPFLSHHITGSYPIFADVFLLYDRGNLPLLVDNPAKHALGSAVAHWVINGHPELLHVALENDLLDDQAKGTLMRYAAEMGDVDGLLATVAVTCSEDELKVAVLHALSAICYSELAPPNMYATVLNALVTYGPPSLDPTDILVQHSQMWSRRALAVMMFDLPAAGALHFNWDYARCMRPHLKWAANDWEIRIDSAVFIGALIDKCVEDRTQWDALDTWLTTERAATACALRLGAAAFKYKLIAGHDEPSEVRIVGDKDVGVIEFLASLAAAKIATANASAASTSVDDKKTFNSQISLGARALMCSVVQSATSFSPTTACACDPSAAHASACPVSDPRAIHNLIFDTVGMLDRAFLLTHAAWRHPAAVRVWRWFAPTEVANRINAQSAVGILRMALSESPIGQVADHVTGVVNELPRAVLESSDVFVRGLRGLTRVKWVGHERREAMMRGLDGSQSGQDWSEQIARVTPLPNDADPEEDGDEDEDEFSFFD